MLKEFREFALKGNMVDLAVGVIIGAAFGGLVTALVQDIFTPIIGLLTGGLDFSNLFVQLAGPPQTDLDAARKAGATIAYGHFLTLCINFAIVAFVLFLVIKAMNRMRALQAPPPKGPAPVPPDVELLTEIRDILARRA